MLFCVIEFFQSTNPTNCEILRDEHTLLHNHSVELLF